MISIADAIQRQVRLDAITKSLPLDVAFRIQAAFDKADALQRQAALDAVTVDLPAAVALQIQAVFDA